MMNKEVNDLKKTVFDLLTELKIIKFLDWLNNKLIGINKISKEIHCTFEVKGFRGELSIFEFFIYRYYKCYILNSSKILPSSLFDRTKQ